MSINHYYPSDLQEAHHPHHHWYWPSQQQCLNTTMDSPPPSSLSPPNHVNDFSTNLSHYSNPLHQASMPTTQNNNSFRFNLNHNNNNNEDDEELIKDEHNDDDGIPKEPLFEKPLTPSDVGKLNRLVIPKQHAEKYFPLNNGVGDSGEKGFLLGFEDEVGKSWRFRYSYWNSSQSYVLTKGWSRFVKEKRLDAGDVVLFFRHRVDADRLFIGWRRRQDSGVAQPDGGGWGRVSYSSHPYPSQQQHHGPSALPLHQPDHCLNAGTSVQQQQQEQEAPTSSGNWRMLRLFGVNLECQMADESSTPEGEAHHPHPQPNHISQYQYYSNHHHHMEDIINFSGGAYHQHQHQHHRG